MGGRFGDGPVAPDPHEPLFVQDWHRKAMALTVAAGACGAWNIDMSRFAREALGSRDYNRFSYYEKWIAALADLLVARGLATEAELAAPQDAAPVTPGGVPDAARMAQILARGAPTRRDGPPPRFAPGARVRAVLPSGNRLVRGGHTRLPSYAAGHVGHVLCDHGCHVFPDSHAHGLGEAPQPLYSVSFAAADLWGAAEAEGDTVVLDLWESYLEPVS